MTFEVALLVFGILLFLVGLIGKVKARELEVGTNSNLARIVLTLLGIVLMILSFNPDIIRNVNLGPTEEMDEVPEISYAEISDGTITSDFAEGEYRIQLKENDAFLHLDGLADNLLSIRYEDTDDFTRFIFQSEPDGSYRIVVKATGKYLHEDGMGDRLISTRVQESDDFTKFYIEKDEEGTVRIRGKGSGRYWSVNLTDKLVSTRYQPEDRLLSFYLYRQ